MKITEIRLRFNDDAERGERLLAYCSVTFDQSFVIHEVKLIHGNNGAFLSFPSRRTWSRCSYCQGKNPSNARYCNWCGDNLPHEVPNDCPHDYFDLAHPISNDCREYIRQEILNLYHREKDGDKAFIVETLS